MAPRKRKRSQANTANIPSSRLLSLPSEIRCLIWKNVFGNSSILVFATSFTQEAPAEVKSLSSRVLPTLDADEPCEAHHYRKSAEKIGYPCSLAWLRTSRMIYEEARPVVFSNIRLHFCDPLVLSRFVGRTPTKNLDLIRYLEFGLKIIVEPDNHNGFTLRSALGWERGHPPRACLCPWCFQGEGFDPKAFPSVRHLHLIPYFRCWENAIVVPPQDPLPNGRTRSGRSYRRNNDSAMACHGSPAQISGLVKTLCNRYPLKVFFNDEAQKLETVDVEFRTASFQHDPSYQSLHRGRNDSDCWCMGRSIDEKSLDTSGMGEQIEQRLLNRQNEVN